MFNVENVFARVPKVTTILDTGFGSELELYLIKDGSAGP